MNADTVIVGGGIVGLCTAAAAVHRGDTVVVVDPGSAATAVSAASGGLIRRFDLGGRLGDLATAGFDRLRESAQTCAAFHRTGALTLQYSSQALPTHIRARTMLYAARAMRQRWPQITVPPNVIGVFEDGAGWVDAPVLLATARTELADRGVEFVTDRVDRLVVDQRRIGGVVTGGGRSITASRVVVAAGSSTTGLAATAGVDHPLRTRRIGYCYLRLGSDRTAGLPTIVDRVSGTWVRPCRDPELVLIGRRQEIFGVPAEIRHEISDADVHEIRTAIAQLLPEAADAPLVGGITAYDVARPDPADPPLRHCVEPRGLTVVAGWNGAGFKAAPAIAELALGDRVSVEGEES
ncbi:FAD-binding oxidoreductase [Nocardia sp. CA2R105]|uniref:NAD(P)/FAD-dependent oxidoreductase n=1 Tax=Nocardia coffeae TaxID=2873381 RepID=UPI001CA63838|nr:FAD-binding oxidoreductase [Nocardia coffeae]MBY8863520.1 FAD-binding oxidoreductase [Nocardia coffeae]